MTIIEHFDIIDRLIVGSSVPAASEIRGHLIAMREQIEAYHQKAEELSKLEARLAELEAANEKLVANNCVIDAQSIPMKPSSRNLGGML